MQARAPGCGHPWHRRAPQSFTRLNPRPIGAWATWLRSGPSRSMLRWCCGTTTRARRVRRRPSSARRDGGRRGARCWGDPERLQDLLSVAWQFAPRHRDALIHGLLDAAARRGLIERGLQAGQGNVRLSALDRLCSSTGPRPDALQAGTRVRRHDRRPLRGRVQPLRTVHDHEPRVAMVHHFNLWVGVGQRGRRRWRAPPLPP